MFDLIFHEGLSEKQLLVALNQRMHDMALDLSKLTAAVTRSTAASDAVLAELAKANDPAVQAALDAAALTLDTESSKVEATLPPTPAAPASA